jgi:hypothetical protein
LRRRLAEQKMKLSIPGDDYRTANREYIRRIALREDAEPGRSDGLSYAEPFHYSRG